MKRKLSTTLALMVTMLFSLSLTAYAGAPYNVTIISDTNVSETLDASAVTVTGTFFHVACDGHSNRGWLIGQDGWGDGKLLTFSSLSGKDLSNIVLTVGGNVNISGRNPENLQVDHGSVSATGTAQGSTVTITNISSNTVTIKAPYTNSASMWTFTKAEIQGAVSHMTKTTDSGAESQTGLSGPMTSVVYTADDGYYFPTDYSVSPVNDITVTRDSYTQITVSGTPNADVVITLTQPIAKTKPDAPTTVTAVNCTAAGNDGKLIGVTTEMEYKKSDAADWTDGTGEEINGLVPGTYYVRIKETEATYASDNQTLTISISNSPVAYQAWDGTSKTVKNVEGGCTEYTVVTSDDTAWGTASETTWYVVNSDVTIADRITVSGTVNLILCDGAKLTASKGITVNSENTLNIYAQSEGEGSGALIATGPEFEGDNAYAGIGGTTSNAGGTVIIHGGNVTAKGGKFGAGGAAGIGGGFQGAGGSVTIYAGTVDATGNSTGAGIGGGSERAGGSVAIYGGTVTATGGVGGGAGIGGGSRSAGGSVAIYGGTVTATGGSDEMLTGMGIGAGGTFTFEDPLDGGSLTLGTGVTMEVSSDNSTWTDYNGSTRAQYMKTAVTVIEFLLTLDAVSNGTLAIVGEELPEGVTATATEGQYKVVSGTSVTIKATPAEGYHLVSWSNSADMNEDDTQTITLTDDLTLSATFAADVVTPVGSVTIQDTEADEWYDLTGRRLNGKPATRGLYIHNNTKTIVK